MGLLLIICILPDPGHTRPLFDTGIAEQETFPVFTKDAFPGKVLDEEMHYNLGSDIFTFSALYHEQTGLSGYESSLTAGFGRHLFESENLHLGVNLGAGQRIVQIPGASSTADAIARLGLSLTLQPGGGPLSLRHNLVIETDRSTTASEYMTTWSYAVNPRLDLELTSAVRKGSRNPSVDPLEVRHRASFTLEWAF